MTTPYLVLASLLALSFTLATQLGLWREQSDRNQTRSGSLFEVLMGDSRRLFANHFLVKADEYLHGGVYPSIFDQPRWEKQSFLSKAAVSPAGDHGGPGHGEEAHSDEDHRDHSDSEAHDAASGFLGQPRDWLDAFGRNFFPTRHVHLEKAEQKEILPWLRLAAELNPNQIETYTVAAYWLRSRMGKVREAEAFLREGWRANPNSYEILFELGRLYEENRNDMFRARNLYEYSLKKWRQNEQGKPDPDQFAFMQITIHLAKLEETDGRLDKAIDYLQLLRTISPHPQEIQNQIDDLKSRASRPSAGTAAVKPSEGE